MSKGAINMCLAVAAWIVAIVLGIAAVDFIGFAMRWW